MLYFFKSKIKFLSLIRRCFDDPLFITKRVRRLQAEILVPNAKGVVLDIGWYIVSCFSHRPHANGGIPEAYAD